MCAHYARQFAYNEWANREVLAAVSAAPVQAARSLQFLGHILAAEQLWLERIQAAPQSTPVWPAISVEECTRRLAEVAKAWRSYIDLLTDEELQRTVSYRNSKGEPWSSEVGDILTHVLMHSAYHRGQAALDMRSAGLTPAYTDFILCVRQGLIK